MACKERLKPRFLAANFVLGSLNPFRSATMLAFYGPLLFVGRVSEYDNCLSFRFRLFCFFLMIHVLCGVNLRSSMVRLPSVVSEHGCCSERKFSPSVLIKRIAFARPRSTPSRNVDHPRASHEHELVATQTRIRTQKCQPLKRARRSVRPPRLGTSRCK